MRKFLLVIFIGMAVAMSVYGIVTEIMNDDVVEVDHIKETTVTVYTE